MQLDSKALGLAMAIFSAGGWLVIMTVSLLTGVGDMTLKGIGSLHPFFSYSWGGMVIMVIEHLIGGFIVGWLLVWLYNKFLPKKVSWKLIEIL